MNTVNMTLNITYILRGKNSLCDFKQINLTQLQRIYIDFKETPVEIGGVAHMGATFLIKNINHRVIFDSIIQLVK